ncbi:MAG: translation initiation factor IF-2 N-terminal domain-containing protein, partial [Lachnospiraceae bacterium]|nr:translation initiation factor IF-2 N-terminal domain-containing protein [Lachnospiraceae bacterium]
MAKIKVYELAQEMGVKSSDILAILKNKGIEVKSHMSLLEDGQVEEVKKSLKEPEKSEQASKTTDKNVTTGETKTSAKTGEAPVKKKKNIIFVSNPQNSKMQGNGQIPKKVNHAEKSVAHTEKKAAPQAPVRQADAAKSAAEKVQEALNAVLGEKKPKKAAAPVKAEPEQVKETVTKKEGAVVAEKTEEKVVADTVVESKESIVVKEQPQETKVSAESKPAVEKTNTDTRKEEYVKKDNNKNFDGQRRDNRDNRETRDGQRSFNKDNRDNRDGQRRETRDGQRSFNRDNRDNRDGQRRDNRDNRDGFKSQDRGFNKDKDSDRNGKFGGRDNRGGFGNKQNNKNSGFVPEAPAKEAEKHRDEEKRRISQEKDKKNRKDLMYEEDGDMKNIKGKNKPGKFIKPEKKVAEVVEEQIKVITVPEKLTIKELADKMKIQPSAIVKKLFMQGQIVTVNQEISYETAENIAIEYDIICEQEVKVDVIEELLKETEENPEDMVSRPPVICVMGHVDHGKTSLLDAIRKTNVTDKEAGGITQHIGAYTVTINDQKITFLDTPGHEAFTAMRMRGANSTDIAILVVAADDGVMPQTVEAINHAKAAGIEIIVAVNKIDKPGANIERVKQELTEYGLIAEDWGGSTVFVPVSAKSGEGIENLLEMILLTAEVLELKANPNRKARGLVIEAEL